MRHFAFALAFLWPLTAFAACPAANTQSDGSTTWCIPGVNDGASGGIAAPASSAPPAVNVTGAIGTSTQYARADHTHISSVQKGSGTTVSGGTVTFNFPSGFFDVTPVVSVDIIDANPASVLGGFYTYSVPTLTKDQMIVRVQKVALIGLVVTDVVGVKVNIFAGKATM